MLYVDMEVNGVPMKVLTWYICPVCFFLIVSPRGHNQGMKIPPSSVKGKYGPK